jgi:tRNA dimethylallyltransferase
MVTVITGPTASGKSALALALAARVDGTIINADASQLYTDLRVLTARPSVAEETAVPHRLFGVLDGDVVTSAAGWAEMAKAAIADTLAEGRRPILVGGTGLYLATLLHGIAPVPDIDVAVRDAVRVLPTEAAAAALAREDAALAARLRPTDRQRLLRGLEVVRSTGRSLLDWQQQRLGGIAEAITLDAMVVEVPRAELHRRAETRLGTMLDKGALDEVAALMARRLPADRPILRALGVSQLAAYLAGDLPLPTALAQIAAATRQYQKRQSTWGRGQVPDWRRVEPGG